MHIDLIKCFPNKTMNFPNNISKNSIKVYHISGVEFKPTKRILCINLNQWSSCIPKSLKEWCIQAICNNWAETPIVNELPLLTDILSLLDILPTDLPLPLTVTHIAYDCYWLRCYQNRWPQKPPIGRNFSEIENLTQDRKEVVDFSSSLTLNNRTESNKSPEESNNHKSTGGNSRESIKSSPSSAVSSRTIKNESRLKTWKELYLEMHIKEYLENLEPENYNPEKIKEIITLCRNYITCLSLSEVRAPTKTDVPDHVPLNAILSDLHNLTELSLCFKQTYVGEKFSWHIFNTTMTDIKNLAKGLEQTKLQVLRIQNSDINCVKIKMLLKALARNQCLRELEISHCKIADHGTMAISKFVEEHKNLKHLILTNNFIGPNGAKSLAYVLFLNCKLLTLNLRLNMIRSKGGEYLNKVLVKGGRYLRSLIVAGCGLTEENLEIQQTIHNNGTLKELDISNNRLGEEIGEAILKGLEHNKSLMHLDVRRCNFTADSEWGILKMIKENRSRRFAEIPDSYRETTEDAGRDIFSEEFIEEFNSVFGE